MNEHYPNWQGRFVKTNDLIDRLRNNPIEPNNKPRLVESLQELAQSLHEVMEYLRSQNDQASPS